METTGRFATTPFGARTLSAASLQYQEKVRRQQEWLRKNGRGGDENDNHNGLGVAHKWRLLRELTDAREAFGLSDRTIAVLDALCSFHQSDELDGAEPIIVFPSNAELSNRTRGMAPATLRRHLAALVKVGFIIRRDSPNGKRYCRRDHQGMIADAFGFDLAPFALRADEIFQQAEEARAYSRTVEKARREITVHLRDIAKTIEAAERDDLWSKEMLEGFREVLVSLSGRVARHIALEEHQDRCEALLRLRAEVEAAYLASVSDENLYKYDELSANESNFERHIQNSNKESYFDKSLKNKLKERPDSISETISSDGNSNQNEETTSTIPPLAYVLDVCSDISDYSSTGIEDWRDLLVSAGLVRTMLGISPDAWDRARQHMGDQTAAIVVAAILQRAESIKSPGGYLRSLTTKAEAGKFSVHPMLRALE